MTAKEYLNDSHFEVKAILERHRLRGIVEDLMEGYAKSNLINGWIEIQDNQELFNETAKKNCLCKFDDGSECNYNSELPFAEMTHFKLI